MKKIINKNIATLLVAFGLCLLASCDLKLQKPFEYEPEVPTLTTFKDKTVWDWLQTQKSADTAKVKANNKFDFLIDAITYAGLENDYKSGSDQTFILLNNLAFTAANEINFALTGKVAGPITTADKTRLANLLKAHIVTAYVDQINAVPVFGKIYEFNTKGTGANSKMNINRNERYALFLNNSATLPSTRKAVGGTTGLPSHNYIFSNGIAHLSNNYTRLEAF